MTIVGDVIERKSVGINLSLNGVHNNTQIVQGVLQLKPTTINGVITYPEKGRWISEVINIGDNFREYDNILSTIVDDGLSRVELFTRTSQNGVNFSDWIILNSENKIQSPKNQYIQVAIDVYSAISESTIEYDLSKYESEYVEFTNGIVDLKNKVTLVMEKDSTWTETGELFRSKVDRTTVWKRIDKMNVL